MFFDFWKIFFYSREILLRTKKYLYGAAKIFSGIVMIFAFLGKYFDLPVNVLVGSGQPLFAFVFHLWKFTLKITCKFFTN